jgi:hypothetical protein
VRAIEEPSTVGLLPAVHDMQGLADACVGLETCVPEIVECTENVVVVTGRERELQERRIRDLAGRAPSEEPRSSRYSSPRRLATAISGADPATRSYSSNPSSTQIVL